MSLENLTLPNIVEKVLKQALSVLSPPPILSVSEWADRYRKLSAEASAEPGQWDTSRAEYQRGIFDAVSDNSVQMVVVMSSAQVGKTEIVLNTLGYHMHQDPAPILAVMPTVEMAKALSQDRVRTMIRDSPELKNILVDSLSRISASTILHKVFPGGHLTLAGANSPTGLSSRPCRLILLDEVDRFPLTSGREGDPVNLALKRSTTFFNRKALLTSTPTDRETSRILKEYENSDQRKYYIPCQHCGEHQALTWESVKWPKGKPTQAQIMCAHCGVLWSELDRQRAVLHGEWRAGAPFAGVAGFHISELYSPWSNPARMAVAFTKASKEGQDSLKTFINTALGEPWEPPEGERVDWEMLFERREEYRAPVPYGVQVLVAGVDCQDNRIEGEIVGVGHGEETWGIMTFRIHGDLGKQAIWGDLLEVLKTQFEGEDGELHDIRLVCIDSGGHFTDEVYRFSRGAGRNWVIPVKGSSERGRPIAAFPRKQNRQGVYLTIVGTDTAKELIYSRYQVTEPGVGYCHLPKNDEYNETWCRQATAEEKCKRYKNGVPYYVWEARERDNEALDCRVYALTALRILQQHMGVKLREFVQHYSRKPAKITVRKPSKVENPYL